MRVWVVLCFIDEDPTVDSIWQSYAEAFYRVETFRGSWLSGGISGFEIEPKMGDE